MNIREKLARWLNEELEICHAAFDADEPCYKHRRYIESLANQAIDYIESEEGVKFRG